MISNFYFWMAETGNFTCSSRIIERMRMFFVLLCAMELAPGLSQ